MCYEEPMYVCSMCIHMAVVRNVHEGSWVFLFPMIPLLLGGDGSFGVGGRGAHYRRRERRYFGGCDHQNEAHISFTRGAHSIMSIVCRLLHQEE